MTQTNGWKREEGNSENENEKFGEKNDYRFIVLIQLLRHS